MYKMAVVDIDGTLSAGGNLVSERVVQAVRATCRGGAPVCVCTGRCAASARPVIDRLDTGMPYATIDGLVVFDGKTHEIIEENILAPEILADCLGRAYHDGLYMEAVANERYNKFAELNPAFDYGLGRLNTLAKYHNTFDSFLNDAVSCYELILGGDEAAIELLRQGLAREYGDKIGIRHGLWDGYLFIAAPIEGCNKRIDNFGFGKADGCRRLAARFGFKPEEVVAIGDDLNDLDMLESAGMGVAMENSVERAKLAAKYIAPSVEDDGVAIALERFFQSGS